MNSDFRDLLRAFAAEEVRYLVVGGHAVIHYTQPRFTKDLDLWIEPSAENAERLRKAFLSFGIPLLEVTPEDFAEPGLQYVVGLPPVQFDFLTTIPGLDFVAAWQRRERVEIHGIEIQLVSREDLIVSKRAAGRARDLADLEDLEQT
jgi:predicted nucleotidyltransferase